MFKKILIANRGEIACRIISTAHSMGIQTVAIYSDQDTTAQHVKLADEAFYIGASAARDSYLKADAIIKIAKQSAAEAIHPGYGFLSENAEFAQSCLDNKIEFIGPPVDAIIAMGSKSAAKRIMTKANIPLVPGYHGDNQEVEFLQQEAEKIGYPVLLKAIAGGGGKGMRIVTNSEEFSEQLIACKREAASSFGDDQVLIEKYLEKPRHVEIQIFSDKHGNAVHLFERDCSVQRRHQKVIEEAPAPSIPETIREKLGEVAIQSAKAIGYVGAGTVEFLYTNNDDFYFMEMNTRLQVEHPVTEMITSQDLVEWQLRVASGQKLPLEQNQIIAHGHAFEVRIYAEDPQQDFLPATGIVEHLKFPNTSPHVRIDSGIVEGDEIGIHYDPMIAKLIVWDETRETALARLENALADCQIGGLTTNLPFLAAIARNPSFKNFSVDTSFIEREHDALFSAEDAISNEDLAIAALFLILKRQQLETDSNQSADFYSPWKQVNGWRLNKDNFHPFKFTQKRPVSDRKNTNATGSESLIEHRLIVHFREHGYLIEIDSETVSDALEISGEITPKGEACVTINGHRLSRQIIVIGEELIIFSDGKIHNLSFTDETEDNDAEVIDGNLAAPMPGSVISLLVKAGDKVKAGHKLLVLEAMKMEHSITAPADGIVEEVFFAVGDQVTEGAQLLQFNSNN